jgi:hypothetical protein
MNHSSAFKGGASTLVAVSCGIAKIHNIFLRRSSDDLVLLPS